MKPLDTLVLLRNLPFKGVAPPFEQGFAEELAACVSEMSGLCVYPGSMTALPGAMVFLGRKGIEKRMCVLSVQDAPGLYAEARGDAKPVAAGDAELRLKICELTHANAQAARNHMAFLAPRLVGLETSMGLGDRLGLATPGHLRAMDGTGVTPYLAQQSIREMTRTQRSADTVMDCATWGVLEYGWRSGFGSDADHLKKPADVDRTAAAGFTMFTVDPGDYVDSATDTDDDAALARKVEALPWSDLETSPDDCRKEYVGRPMPLDCADGPFGERDLIHAAAKYGKAVAHTVNMYRYLAEKMGDRPFELECSVDETDTPTTEYEHYYIASELRRLGVRWVSLAPRFLGAFEKGVDYIGDLDVFRKSFAKHAAISRRFGPYKISLHSGSDKFSVYPIAAEECRGSVHVKTAGTSYLEAVRALGTIEPDLFREILAFAHERYAEDKATYHVSADPARVPQPGDLADEDLPGVLDLFDGRQLLHVTFGSVLTAEGGARFRDRMLTALRQDEETHYSVLCKHIQRHVSPFAVR